MRAPLSMLKFIKLTVTFSGFAIALILVFLPPDLGFSALAQEPAKMETKDATGQESEDAQQQAAEPLSCATCHGDIVAGLTNTAHAKITSLKEMQCATCHGDGVEHASDPSNRIRNPKKMVATEASETCLQCHSRSEHTTLWRGSSHESSGLSCVSCHSMHSSGGGRTAALRFNNSSQAETKLLIKRTEADTCYTCHGDVRKAQYQRSTHLIRSENGENRMKCSSCHDVHGAIGPNLMRSGNINETCYTCHTEKRGPFLWEHAPARENCMTCHKAHGSNNTALLAFRQPMLCQQCHIQGRHQTVAGKANSTWMTGRSCVGCHAQIHGSNHPSGVNLQR